MPAGAFLGEYFVKGLTKYSRRGLLGEIFDKLRIQGRMQVFEKMSQSALNHVLILQNARSRRADSTPLKIIDLQNDFIMLVAKQWKIRILVPMSSIKLILIISIVFLVYAYFKFYVSQSDLQLQFSIRCTIIIYSPISKL